MCPEAFSAPDLQLLLGGQLEGRPAEGGLRRLAPPETAGPEDVAVAFDRRAARSVEASRAGLMVCSEDLALELPAPSPPLLRVADPARAFVQLLRTFHPERVVRPGIHPSAVVDRNARVAASASIGALCVVEGAAEIGEDSSLGPQCTVEEGVVVGQACRIGPGVRLLRGTLLGDGVEIGAGSVLGERGFGYLDPDAEGRREAIPQVGGVRIGSGTHIGALCAIDRGTLGDTEVGPHARLDNLVQLGHNARVEAGAVLVAQVGVAGSAHIGKGALLAGQSGVADHRRIGDGAVLVARAAAFGDVPPGETYGGIPARPHRQWLNEQARLSRLAKHQTAEQDGDDHER